MSNAYKPTYQADFNISGFNIAFYFSKGFLEQTSYSANWVHKHPETEIHIGKSGIRYFMIGSDEYILNPGDILAIPANVLHYYKCDTNDTDSRSFLVDIPIEVPFHSTLDGFVCNEFFKSIDEFRETGNLFSLGTILPFICSKFIKKPYIPVVETENIKLLINNFMARNFQADISLDDLADHLHLSPKQTNRLVQKHFGMTFKQALNELRAIITHNMLISRKNTLSEIAEQVLQYQSYSGFWKMYTKALGEIGEKEIFKTLEKQFKPSE